MDLTRIISCECEINNFLFPSNLNRYNGEWYNLPLHGQKLIVPIILRGQIPLTLTVGKFCDMDMIAFAAVRIVNNVCFKNFFLTYTFLISSFKNLSSAPLFKKLICM